jgi:hypothetical protein
VRKFTPISARDLFLAACRLPPELQNTFLSLACGNDDELRTKVELLLEADVRSSVLDAPEGAASIADFLLGRCHDTPSNQTSRDGSNSTCNAGWLQIPDGADRYEQLDEIARGGMGRIIHVVSHAI